MNILWILSALGAALCFGISGFYSYNVMRELGAITFSFLRIFFSVIVFALVVFVLGFDSSLTTSDMILLAISGCFALFLGDVWRYAAMPRIGVRLQAVMYSTHAPFTLLMAAIFLGQPVWGWSLIGTIIVFCGVIVAITLGASKDKQNFEGNPAEFRLGFIYAIATSLAQAAGILIAAQVMSKGVDPLSASLVRSGAALIVLLPSLAMFGTPQKLKLIDFGKARVAFGSMMLGSVTGMTLVLYALKTGPAGIVSTLAATTPIMVLPILWFLNRKRPRIGAWIGACLAVFGIGVIFIVG